MANLCCPFYFDFDRSSTYIPFASCSHFHLCQIISSLFGKWPNSRVRVMIGQARLSLNEPCWRSNWRSLKNIVRYMVGYTVFRYFPSIFDYSMQAMLILQDIEVRNLSQVEQCRALQYQYECREVAIIKGNLCVISILLFS
jgi:hypothetical protein